MYPFRPSDSCSPVASVRKAAPFWVHPNSYLARLLSCLPIIAAVAAAPLLAQSPPKPNIVVILADDLGFGDLGYTGCPDFTTPNINSLITTGVCCANGYVTHPFCSPSRAALLTGRYQQRFGYENNPTVDSTNNRLGLPVQEILLPQLLKSAGYVSGIIGKWHLGASAPFHPIARGFDEFYGFLGGSSGYFDATVLRDYTPVVETEYLTDGFSREAESFIDRHAAEPFFLYLSYNAPHSPNEASQAYLDRVPDIADPNRRIHAAMIIALDDGVGRVLAALANHNLMDNTLIFFLSDNGAPNQTYTRNLPYRGYKFDQLEGGIHVPFLVRWDAQFAPGLLYDAPVSALDIVATVAAAAEVPLPIDRTYDGLNLIPYFKGEETAPDRSLFWRWFGLGPTGPTGSANTLMAVRKGPLKLVVAAAASSLPPALYDLENDLDETQDLATTQPADVADLTQLYANWNLDMVAPFFQFNSPFLIGSPDTITLAGDWNGFQITDVNPPWGLSWISAPGTNGTPDAINWYVGTIRVAASGGDTVAGTHAFTLIGGKSYANQWGGGAITADAVNSLSYLFRHFPWANQRHRARSWFLLFLSGSRPDDSAARGPQAGDFKDVRAADQPELYRAKPKLTLARRTRCGEHFHQPAEVCRGANLSSLDRRFLRHLPARGCDGFGHELQRDHSSAGGKYLHPVHGSQFYARPLSLERLGRDRPPDPFHDGLLPRSY